MRLMVNRAKVNQHNMYNSPRCKTGTRTSLHKKH